MYIGGNKFQICSDYDVIQCFVAHWFPSHCRLVLFCVHWVLTILLGYILQLVNCLEGTDLWNHFEVCSLDLRIILLWSTLKSLLKTLGDWQVLLWITWSVFFLTFSCQLMMGLATLPTISSDIVYIMASVLLSDLIENLLPQSSSIGRMGGQLVLMKLLGRSCSKQTLENLISVFLQSLSILILGLNASAKHLRRTLQTNVPQMTF